MGFQVFFKPVALSFLRTEVFGQGWGGLFGLGGVAQWARWDVGGLGGA